MEQAAWSGDTAVPLIQPMQIKSGIEDVYLEDDKEKDCGWGMKRTGVLGIDSLSGYAHAEDSEEHEVLEEGWHLGVTTLLGFTVDPSSNYDEKQDDK